MSENAQSEEALRTLHEAGADSALATLALQTYGGEILGFLIALLRDEQQAREVYSRFSLDLWAGLSSFGWKSSFRTWAYAIAKNAASRHQNDPYLKKRRSLETLRKPGGPGEPVEQRRTTTAWHRRSEIKEKIRALRDALAPDDRALLILRIDRKMSWRNISSIMFDGDVGKAALLRKRHERICLKLRKMAQAEGLLPQSDQARGAA